MTDHATPLLRDALARAMHGHFHGEYDWDADAILHALANDPEVESSCWKAVAYARLNDETVAAVLFGEPDD